MASVSKIQRGIRIVLGNRPEIIPPIVDAPAGRQKLIFRNDSFARLAVRNENGIRIMPLEDCGTFWRARPDLTQKENVHIPPRRVKVDFKPTSPFNLSPVTRKMWSGADIRKFLQPIFV